MYLQVQRCLKVQNLSVCTTYRHLWGFIHKWTFVSKMSNSCLYSDMWGFYRILKFHLLVLCSCHYIPVRMPGNSYQSIILTFKNLNMRDRQHISKSMSFWQIRMLIFLKINFRHLALYILMIASCKSVWISQILGHVLPSYLRRYTSYSHCIKMVDQESFSVIRSAHQPAPSAEYSIHTS